MLSVCKDVLSTDDMDVTMYTLLSSMSEKSTGAVRAGTVRYGSHPTNEIFKQLPIRVHEYHTESQRHRRDKHTDQT